MNRLATEPSPYLQQHAGNPVDWWPWCPEAFEQARARDVPVLISVGYSACHWCHVMAHETFEDAEVAGVLNQGFVSIKVDREEHPDVDAAYMQAVQLVAGRGGWPMTVLALADGSPFWGGTYLPKASFLALVRQVGELWATQRATIEAGAQRLAQAVRGSARLPSGPARPASGRSFLDEASEALVARADPEWGGFSPSPKFPEPPCLELLALHWWRTGSPASEQAWRLALDAMSSGGIYDHLGGGFARYSTDRRWLVPHFEKMLYDNALLVTAYVHAWQLTRSGRYRQVVEETVGYLLRPPVRLPEGAWASSEDADSEGEEGRFYTWSYDEVRQVGGEVATEWYGARPEGNWQGRNILWRPGLGSLARPAEVEQARQALFAHRERRARPGLDTKVVAEWNAMAVSALLAAGSALGRPEWVAEARRTGEALLARLRRDDGRWLRCWAPAAGRAATAPPLACAGDYAWLVDAFTRLGEATGRASWTSAACETATSLIELFWDPADGAFRTTGADAEAPVARLKDVHDGACPSANATAVLALARLGELTGEARYLEVARRALDALAPAMATVPAAFCAMACAASYLDGPPSQVVVSSSATDLVKPVWERYLPYTVVAWGEPSRSPLWEGRRGPEARGKAFVCEGYACQLPVATPAGLARQLDALAPPQKPPVGPQGPAARPQGPPGGPQNPPIGTDERATS